VVAEPIKQEMNGKVSFKLEVSGEVSELSEASESEENFDVKLLK
jgi:hypothetical protein